MIAMTSLFELRLHQIRGSSKISAIERRALRCGAEIVKSKFLQLNREVHLLRVAATKIHQTDTVNLLAVKVKTA